MYGASSRVIGGNMHIKTDTDPDTGYQYEIRMNFCGCYCGYVALPSLHPLYGAKLEDERIYELDVHGGVTYSDILNLAADDESHALDTAWCIGFDTAHMSDYQPLATSLYYANPMYKDMSTQALARLALERQRKRLDPCTFGNIENYKSLEYVEAQCLKLAKQLKALDKF